MGKVTNSVRLLLSLLLAATFLYSAYKLLDYYVDSQESVDLNEQIIEQSISSISTSVSNNEDSESEIVVADETEPPMPVETSPISVDFDTLKEANDDVIGWLYCEDTPINYPVLQSDDNSYYLRRLVNGEWNIAGSLFMDYRNNLSNNDWNTVIYGHNMKNDSMFGTLPEYRNQDYYEQHPVMYFLTPEADYKIELIAGFVTPSDSALYDVYLSESYRTSLYDELFKLSDFQANEYFFEKDVQLLTVSTCSYEYETARYVVVGKMIPVEKMIDVNIKQSDESEYKKTDAETK